MIPTEALSDQIECLVRERLRTDQALHTLDLQYCKRCGQ